MREVAAVVLAAGSSVRLGRPKQLALHQGEPLLHLAARSVCQSHASAAAVVLGSQRERMRAAVLGLPVQVLENESWQEGMASSIRMAVAWAEQKSCAGLLLVLCDQPRLTAAHLNALIERFAGCGSAVASRYSRRYAAPALFPRRDFDALARLEGDAGARSLLNTDRRIAHVVWPDGAYDVDTLDDERALLGKS